MSVAGDIRNARLVPTVAEPKSERLSVSWSVANAKTSLLARARSNPARIVHAPTGTLNKKPSPALCACDGGAIAVIAVAVSSSARSVRMIGLRCGSLALSYAPGGRASTTIIGTMSFGAALLVGIGAGLQFAVA